MVQVLFVCLGNICRSPMAEAVFRNEVQKRGLSGQITVDSAGTAGYHIGKSPDHRTLEVLEENGLNTSHKGRKISVEDFDAFDHIVVMDEENFEHVHNLYHKTKHSPPAAQKLFLMRDYDPQVRGVQEVPDPYYGSKEEFKEVYSILKRSSEVLLDHLIELYQLEPDEDEGV
jgi:protein-tyrosine phosphatase